MEKIIQPKAISLQQLKVNGGDVTIDRMTDDIALAEFSDRLNEICDDMQIPPKGRSRQTDLAKTFDVSQNAARKWLEAEGYCSIAMGKRIAAWAGVSFDWLMTGEGDKRPGESDPRLPQEAQALLRTITTSARAGSLTPEQAAAFDVLIKTTTGTK